MAMVAGMVEAGRLPSRPGPRRCACHRRGRQVRPQPQTQVEGDMINEQDDVKFAPVNMGQALAVLADIVAAYVSTMQTPGIEDQKKASQLSVAIFLHSLLIRAQH